MAVVAATGARAHAGPAYEQALAAYDRVEYAQAVRAFELALGSEALGKAELERAYYLLGSALLGDGQTERAASAFRTLFAIQPGFRAEADASPKVRELMARVHAQGPRVEARLVPLSIARSGGQLEAEVEIAGPTGLTPTVEYRAADEPMQRHRLALACAGPRCRARLPAGTTAYRFGLLTPEGALALATDELRPSASAAPATERSGTPTSTPLYKKWWLWTAVGVVLLGAIVGGAVGGSQAQRAASSITISIRKDCGLAAVCPLWAPASAP
jgi:tetratricopeptide (TPR) repeat protein